jgi:hypothetical protein
MEIKKDVGLMAALKGAFIKLGGGLLGALPNIVVFQFNPDRVTRTPRLVQPRGGERLASVELVSQKRFDRTALINAATAYARSQRYSVTATNVITAARKSNENCLGALRGQEQATRRPLSGPSGWQDWESHSLVSGRLGKTRSNRRFDQ